LLHRHATYSVWAKHHRILMRFNQGETKWHSMSYIIMHTCWSVKNVIDGSSEAGNHILDEIS
jgi:hypothetical protein